MDAQNERPYPRLVTDSVDSPRSSASHSNSRPRDAVSQATSGSEQVAHKKRNKLRDSLKKGFSRGLSFPREADRMRGVNENHHVVVEDFDDEEEDDDISTPYNPDKIHTHIIPHGRAPDKNLQHLFDAPLQHRVPVDESEARRLEHDLKTLMGAFENGHGDPFGLENDPIVHTMHQLRAKQEGITAQMFALDHTEYWNADNRFGMQKMKDHLNNMITAVDDLCQNLQQIPSHDEFGAHRMPSSSLHRRRRRGASKDAQQQPAARDDSNKNARGNNIADGGSLSSADDELRDDDAAAAGGLTFKAPFPVDRNSADTKFTSHKNSNNKADKKAAPRRPPEATTTSAAHKPSRSDVPIKTDAAVGTAHSSALSKALPTVADKTLLPHFSAADGPPKSSLQPPQAPPRSTRVRKGNPNVSTLELGDPAQPDISGRGSGDHRPVDWAAEATKPEQQIAGGSGGDSRLPTLPDTIVDVQQHEPLSPSISDSSSSDATVSRYTSTGTKSTVEPAKNLLNVNSSALASATELSPVAPLTPRTSRIVNLQMTERSVSPIQSPSTESFQSAISPFASPV